MNLIYQIMQSNMITVLLRSIDLPSIGGNRSKSDGSSSSPIPSPLSSMIIKTC